MLTNFPNGISSFGVPVIGGLGGIPFTGNWYFVDYANGSDTYDGTVDAPKKTLASAYAKCTSGKNDVVVIVGDGSTTATQRVDSAFTWAKNATHLIGIAAPSLYSQRARIAPTATTTAFANFFTVSGSGCYFSNVQFWHGFNTGTTAAIAMTVSGSRNVFQNCHIAGMGDDASAQDTGSRCVKITGGENRFLGCVIGIDTVTRTVANATIELASGAARNTFEECVFPFMTSSADVLGFITSAAAACDRTTAFVRCRFENAVESSSTGMTAVATMAASSGGAILFKDCCLMGITGFGSDATTRGQAYIEGGTPAAASTGLAVAPTA